VSFCVCVSLSVCKCKITSTPTLSRLTGVKAMKESRKESNYLIACLNEERKEFIGK